MNAPLTPRLPQHDPTRPAVWAPRASRVRLVTSDPGGPRSELDARPGSWFVLPQDSAPLAPGTRYAFEVLPREDRSASGAESWSQPLPDPRSRRQPDGVHGFSEVYLDDFSFSDSAWTGRGLAGQVLYELHVGTFSPDGTFAGAAAKLDYLAELGVTAIELMPVQPFSGTRNWGYDPVSWYAVHEDYGGPDELKKLIDAAHSRGIAVVLDMVFNHFGPEGNYTGMFGPYTTPAATSWGDVVNLMGAGSDEVRAFILSATRQWLAEFHVDGLRLDAVHALDDRGAVSLLEQIAAVAREVQAATGRERFIIAESDLNDPRLITSPDAQGCGLDAQWLDDLHHCLHTLTEGEQHAYYCDFGRLSDLARVLRSAYRFQGDYSIFRGRSHGRGFDTSKVPGSRFIVYTTTHDQTGNRAAGDRATQRISRRQHLLKCAFVALSPFTPMIFMGEEYGATTPFPFFVSHGDEDLLEATRAGRLREFASAGWDPLEVADPASKETFAAAHLDWSADEEEARTLAAVRRLLQLRRELAAGATSLAEISVDYQVTRTVRPERPGAVALEQGWLAVNHPRFVLVGNFSGEEVTVAAPAAGTLVFGTGEPAVRGAKLTLAPWAFAVLDTSGPNQGLEG